MKTNHRSSFLPWILVAALLVHLFVPVVCELGIGEVKALQHAKLTAGGWRREYSVLRVHVALFRRSYEARQQELQLDDALYDVAHYSNDGDTVICHVIRDEAEQKLIKKIAAHAEGKARTVHKFLLWSAAYSETATVIVLPRLPQKQRAFRRPDNQALRLRRILDCESPPPESMPVPKQLCA